MHSRTKNSNWAHFCYGYFTNFHQFYLQNNQAISCYIILGLLWLCYDKRKWVIISLRSTKGVVSSKHHDFCCLFDKLLRIANRYWVGCWANQNRRDLNTNFKYFPKLIGRNYDLSITRWPKRRICNRKLIKWKSSAQPLN